MNRTLYFFTLLLAVAGISCEETVRLDADQLPPQVVIEGLVTDQPRRHYVRVTRSNGFYDHDDVSGISDAVVTVQDEQGNVYDYAYAPNQNPGADGYYFSETVFAGVAGATYTLSVTTGDEVYTATDILKPVTDIDSLSVTIDRGEFRDPQDPGYYYEVLIYAREPQDREDYYLFKFYRNDSIIVGLQTDIYFADDELLGERIDGLPIPGFYSQGDTARVEMYSLSREAYVFYNDLYTLMTSDGGMFSPPPANPRNNISNDGLGFFQTSAAAIEHIVVR